MLKIQRSLLLLMRKKPELLHTISKSQLTAAKYFIARPKLSYHNVGTNLQVSMELMFLIRKRLSLMEIYQVLISLNLLNSRRYVRFLLIKFTMTAMIQSIRNFKEMEPLMKMIKLSRLHLLKRKQKLLHIIS